MSDTTYAKFDIHSLSHLRHVVPSTMHAITLSCLVLSPFSIIAMDHGHATPNIHQIYYRLIQMLCSIVHYPINNPMCLFDIPKLNHMWNYWYVTLSSNQLVERFFSEDLLIWKCWCFELILQMVFNCKWLLISSGLENES